MVSRMSRARSLSSTSPVVIKDPPPEWWCFFVSLASRLLTFICNLLFLYGLFHDANRFRLRHGLRHAWHFASRFASCLALCVTICVTGEFFANNGLWAP